MAQAFHYNYNTTDSSLDLYVDSGASAHITSSASNLTTSIPYIGNDHAAFGNGNLLNISHIGNASITKNIDLADALVVPRLTKNLVSISKLTADSHVDVLFYDNTLPFRSVKARRCWPRAGLMMAYTCWNKLTKLWCPNSIPPGFMHPMKSGTIKWDTCHFLLFLC